MRKIEDPIEICDISDDEIEDYPPIEPVPSTSMQLTSDERTSRPNKLLRTRAPVNQTKAKDADDTILMETSLTTIATPPMQPLVHPHPPSKTHPPASIVLDPSPFIQLSRLQPQPIPSTSSMQSSSRPSSSVEARGDGSAAKTNGTTNPWPSTSNAPAEPELVLSPANLGQ